MRRKQKKVNDTFGINPVPALSIVFIVLLFFVVAAPFKQERGVMAAGEPGCAIPIVIAVDDHNRIFVEDDGKPRQVDIGAVKSTVSRMLTERPGCPHVEVQAHRHSDMGTVMRVIDQAKMARDHRHQVSLSTVDA